MGEAVSQVVAAGLLRQGPDSVLADVVALVGRGARIDQVTLDDFAHSMLALDDGRHYAFQGPCEYLSFAAMVALSPVVRSARAGGNAGADASATLLRLDEAGIDLQADVNLSNQGATLMHYAAAGGSPAVIRAVMALSGNLRQKDARGRLPIDYAPAHGLEEVKTLLAGGQARQFVVTQRTDAAPGKGPKAGTPTAPARLVAPAPRQNAFFALQQRHAMRK
jgi:hypothetical protein